MRARWIAVVGMMWLAGCSREPDHEFGDRVRAYILANPGVVEDALGKLDEIKARSRQSTVAKAIEKYRFNIERDDADFAANPAGRITLTEFFDYRCPHCLNIAPIVLKIIRDHPDVRVVFKEYPIFGDVSVRASRAAQLVHARGGDYLGVYRAFMAKRPLDVDDIDAVLKNESVNARDLDDRAAMEKFNKHIHDTAHLAAELGIDGTPTFVVGDSVIIGEDPAALDRAVKSAEQASSHG